MLKVQGIFSCTISIIKMYKIFLNITKLRSIPTPKAILEFISKGYKCTQASEVNNKDNRSKISGLQRWELEFYRT